MPAFQKRKAETQKAPSTFRSKKQKWYGAFVVKRAIHWESLQRLFCKWRARGRKADCENLFMIAWTEVLDS
ncbi:hypothetical protein GCM10009304_01580 [Pseudomonas matsuisoli]|uniref:Transposase n=1 Tax=Pseudomonas matsuisoli TaxID=1515666 RepID=A0A917PI74_9PSED|nr:hypothetical protein GCM10009304_01580 [Pseudomonas matsuisoli]